MILVQLVTLHARFSRKNFKDDESATVLFGDA